MNLSGNILDYFFAYTSGLAVSFSPCVYPVMPITAAIIAGVNTTGTKIRSFIISLVYVLGLAVTYSFLAALASWTGKYFGFHQGSPWVFSLSGIVFIIFSLILLDRIPINSLGLNVHKHLRIKNLWGVLFLGMASGLVVGPCTAPILGSLLVYVGSKQNILYGMSLLFVFSYGVGTSLILVGTFSGILGNLPKSGPWLNRVKRFCGVVLLMVGIFFLIKAGRMLI